jgi:hypothetical protein
VIERPIALVILLFASLQCSCSKEDGHPSIADTSRGPVPEDVLLMDHHLVRGMSIDETRLPCSDGQTRVLGPRDALQLVTFTTVGDCSACQPHLAGVAALAKSRLGVNHLFVTYAGRTEVGTVKRAYAEITSDPICWDETGQLWDHYRISHTPVTVLLRSGVIVYLNDGPLTDHENAARFEANVHYFVVAYRSSAESATAGTGRR